MSTVTPHTPQPGYQKRWRHQAFTLMTRSPTALLVTFIGLSLAGLTSAIVGALIVTTLGEANTKLGGAVFSVANATLVSLVALLSTALFFKTDQRPGVTLSSAIQAWLNCVKPISLLIGAFELFWIILLPNTSSETDLSNSLTALGTLEDIPQIILASLIASTSGMAGTLVILVWISYVLFPFLLGIGGGWQEARIFAQHLKTKLPAVNLHLFLTCLVVVMVVVYLPIIGAFVFHFFLAWIYVATRELAGGISENAKEPIKATPIAAHAST